MNYHYYQRGLSPNEHWTPIPENKLDTIANAMFITILSVDSPISDEATKEELAAVKYKGPLYLDLDDAASPASTAINAVQLVNKLEALNVLPTALEIYASGGKGYHIIVPEECFLVKPPKAGLTLLPATYKEMAFNVAVDFLDLGIYTARKGRMFRQANVLRPNGLYKVRISWIELQKIAILSEADHDAAEAFYKDLCSEPRKSIDIDSDTPELANGLMALFDQCKAKVTKSAASRKKAKPVALPSTLPSFEAMLRGEGIQPDAGFHQLAMQASITAHARGMSKDDFLTAAEGMCKTHESDGFRYNTESKRRAELARMWEYTDDNPCYTFNPGAIVALLTHSAPDLKGIEVTEDEVMAGIVNPEDGVQVDDVYSHAGVTMTAQGLYTMTELGPKRILALGFANVTELVSATTNQMSVIEADVTMAGKVVGHKAMSVEDFASVNSLNKFTMPFGQSFNGSDAHARGTLMRLTERARRDKKRMYVVAREGLDIITMPFHEDEEVRDPFLVWADVQKVTPEPKMIEKGVQLKFVGYPDPTGQYRTDLSQAPMLPSWLKEEGNKEQLRLMLHNLLHCQKPAFMGKLLGWFTACHYRMMFHKLYSQFPLLHINGAAGMGKTSLTALIANLHYYRQTPKMLTPTSTLFAVNYAVSGSASIPLILDEFKPAEMNPTTYDRFKLMLRDAYNCRNVERGGGNRENSDYRAVHTTALSAPICFVSEAAESETALMERVVLLTLSKPPVVQAQEFFHKFSYAKDHKELLGIVGSYMAAQIVQRYSFDLLKEEFNEVYNTSRKKLMLQAGEAEHLTSDEVKLKSSTQERTVFNYSVVTFGLQKFSNLINYIFPEEFKEVLDSMVDSVHSTVVDIQAQTVPEWLKVLNSLADMTQVDSMAAYFVRKGQDYKIVEYNGKDCIELYARSFYTKYRIYAATSRSKPLFPNDAAFVHALNNLPALEAKGLNHELNAPGGSHILSLDELRGAGFISPS